MSAAVNYWHMLTLPYIRGTGRGDVRRSESAAVFAI